MDLILYNPFQSPPIPTKPNKAQVREHRPICSGLVNMKDNNRENGWIHLPRANWFMMFVFLCPSCVCVIFHQQVIEV